MFFPTLGSIATKDVETVTYTSSIQEAIDRMHASNHRNIIVTNHSLFYVLTTLDLVSLEHDTVDYSQPVSSLNLKQVPSLGAEENVINAVDISLKEHEYICVLDEAQNLSGIVTNSDIISSVDPQIMFENTTLGSLFEQRYTYETVGIDAGMPKAINVLRASGIDSVIITDRGIPAGILTSKDILRYFKDGEPDTGVRGYMSAPLKTLPIGTPIKDAMSYINTMHFKRIVVVHPDGTLAGIVTQQDLIAQTYLQWASLFKKHYQEIEELSQVLEKENRELTTLATKDRLTGINNRHAFEEQFAKELAYARRHNIDLHLAIIDIDLFKQINDTHGHIVGDTILKEFTVVIGEYIRRSDFFARWGGEEFVLMLRNTSDAHAAEIAENLRRIVEQHAFPKVGSVTCSIGIGRVDTALPLTQNLANADRALYRAKSEGRNRVRSHI
jgi:diguanylate cyclase (GGDEF)-like protein